MQEITLGELWTYLLAIAAAIVTLSKAWDIIAARLKPQKDLHAAIKRHDEQFSRDIDKLREHDKKFEEQIETNGVICRALFAQLNHELSGNGNDILIQSRNELQNYLTNKK